MKGPTVHFSITSKVETRGEYDVRTTRLHRGDLLAVLIESLETMSALDEHLAYIKAHLSSDPESRA